MTRLPDWEQRLHEYIAAATDRPFVFGEHDCWLFASGAVETLTGVDPAADLRGRYSDDASAKALLRDIGAGTFLRLVQSRFKAKPVGLAGRGDLVWVRGGLGVCVGAQALFVGEERWAGLAGVPLREGLVTVPRGAWQKAWAV